MLKSIEKNSSTSEIMKEKRYKDKVERDFYKALVRRKMFGDSNNGVDEYDYSLPKLKISKKKSKKDLELLRKYREKKKNLEKNLREKVDSKELELKKELEAQEEQKKDRIKNTINKVKKVAFKIDRLMKYLKHIYLTVDEKYERCHDFYDKQLPLVFSETRQLLFTKLKPIILSLDEKGSDYDFSPKELFDEYNKKGLIVSLKFILFFLEICQQNS